MRSFFFLLPASVHTHTHFRQLRLAGTLACHCQRERESRKRYTFIYFLCKTSPRAPRTRSYRTLVFFLCFLPSLHWLHCVQRVWFTDLHMCNSTAQWKKCTQMSKRLLWHPQKFAPFLTVHFAHCKCDSRFTFPSRERRAGKENLFLCIIFGFVLECAKRRSTSDSSFMFTNLGARQEEEPQKCCWKHSRKTASCSGWVVSNCPTPSSLCTTVMTALVYSTMYFLARSRHWFCCAPFFCGYAHTFSVSFMFLPPFGALCFAAGKASAREGHTRVISRAGLLLPTLHEKRIKLDSWCQEPYSGVIASSH